MTDKNRNQGEGNREAAKTYNEAQRDFVDSGKVDEKAAEAKRALEKDGDKLKKAEAAGRAETAERDPEVTRDYSNAGSKPTGKD